MGSVEAVVSTGAVLSVGAGGGCGLAGLTRGVGAGSGLGRCPGVRTSSSSALSPNIRLVNDDGERDGSSILTTTEYHYTLMKHLVKFI